MIQDETLHMRPIVLYESRNNAAGFLPSMLDEYLFRCFPSYRALRKHRAMLVNHCTMQVPCHDRTYHPLGRHWIIFNWDQPIPHLIIPMPRQFLTSLRYPVHSQLLFAHARDIVSILCSMPPCTFPYSVCSMSIRRTKVTSRVWGRIVRSSVR